MSFDELPNLVLLLEEQARQAYVRHVRKPRVLGNDTEHRRLSAAAYEARAAQAERNPVFAASLLPYKGIAPTPGDGLPQYPAGVRWEVAAAGTEVKVTVDVAGPVTFHLVAPTPGALSRLNITTTPTRTTLLFLAPVDGLYALHMQVGTTLLGVLYVPVTRAEQRRFRENSRALAFAFRAEKLPRPGAAYHSRLALLMAMRAAALTGQPDLFARLAAAAAPIEMPPSPIALYPHAS